MLNTWVSPALHSKPPASPNEEHTEPLLYYAAIFHHRNLFEAGRAVDSHHGKSAIRDIPVDSVAIVRALVDRGAHLSRLPLGIPGGNRKAWEKNCLFLMISAQDSVSMVQQLVRAGAVPDITALETAARQQQPETVAFILDEWTNDPSTTPEQVDELLSTVVSMGNWTMFRLLDDFGLVPPANKLAENAPGRLIDVLLVQAAIYTIETFTQLQDREKIVTSLIERGADVCARETDTDFDCPLLYWVCRWASSELVQRFLQGQDLDARMGINPGSFPYLFRPDTISIPSGESGCYLHFASLSCNASAVQLLVKSYSSTVVTENGRTPIHWLSLKGHTSLFSPSPNGARDFTAAAKQIIEDLVGSGTNLNEQDVHGRTALHYACRLKMEELIRVLVDLGADADIRDNDTCTPAHHLAQEFGEFNRDDFRGFVFSDKGWYTHSFAQTIKTCFSTEQINAPDGRGMTPLMHACRSCHPERIQWLLHVGADPKLRDHTGQTALHHAMVRPGRYRVREGSFSRPSLWDPGDKRIKEIAQVLTAGGADAQAEDYRGMSPEGVLRDEETRIAPLRVLRPSCAKKRMTPETNACGSGENSVLV